MSFKEVICSVKNFHKLSEVFFLYQVLLLLLGYVLIGSISGQDCNTCNKATGFACFSDSQYLKCDASGAVDIYSLTTCPSGVCDMTLSGSPCSASSAPSCPVPPVPTQPPPTTPGEKFLWDFENLKAFFSFLSQLQQRCLQRHLPLQLDHQQQPPLLHHLTLRLGATIWKSP